MTQGIPCALVSSWAIAPPWMSAASRSPSDTAHSSKTQRSSYWQVMADLIATCYDKSPMIMAALHELLSMLNWQAAQQAIASLAEELEVWGQGSQFGDAAVLSKLSSL